MAQSSRNVREVPGIARWFLPGTVDDEDVFLSRVQIGGNPNCQNQYNVTALCAATNNFKSLSLVQSLLQLGADPNKETYIGNIAQRRKPTGTPLHAAVLSKNAKIVEALLQGGANPNARTSEHKTPLHYVVDYYRPKTRKTSEERVFEKEEELKIFNLLLQHGADIGVRDGEGKTLFQYVCSDEHLSIISILSSEKFDLDVNENDFAGESVLLTAVKNGLGIRYVKELLDRGADPNKANSKMWTPLHEAVRRGASDTVNLLLKYTADPNKFDVHGVTPLHLAVSSDDDKISEDLLKNNASPNSADEKGRTPLHLATSKRHLSKEILKLLVASGADVNLCDKLGKSVHFYLGRNGTDAEILNLLPVLVHQGVDLNIRDILGKPLLLACFSKMVSYSKEDNSLLNEFENVIRGLKEVEVDLNIADWEGKTLLHMAATGGNSGLVECLLRLGGDRNVLDIDGNSPAHIAADYAHYSCVKLLTDGNWSDRQNVHNRTVLKILDDKISMIEDMARNGWERGADIWETFHRVIAVLTSVRERWDRDIGLDLKQQTKNLESFIQKLNTDIPRWMNMTGLCANVFPVPDNVHSPILTEESPLKEISVIEDLKSEKRFPDNLVRPENFQPAFSLIQDENVTISWRQNLTEMFEEAEVFQSTSNFYPKSLQSEFTYIPPAPKAVRNVIRNLSRSVEEHSVGRFHFDDCPCGEEKCEVGRQVSLLVEDLLKLMSSFEPRYKFKCHLTGSVLEGSKLWAPDEFDFMVELTTVKGASLSGGTSHNPSVEISNEQKYFWEDLLDNNGNLSCVTLRKSLVLLAWRASFSLDRKKYPNLNFNLGHYPKNYRGLEKHRPLISLSKVGVLLCLKWRGKAFPSLNITVDITPAIPFNKWDSIFDMFFPLPESCSFVKERGYHVIPAGENWRLSFSFVELELIKRFSTGELNLYKSLKLLRDIHINSGAPPSYALKSVVFNYVFRGNKRWLADDLEFNVIRVLLQLLSSASDIKRHFFHGGGIPLLDRSSFSMDWCRFSLVQLTRTETDE